MTGEVGFRYTGIDLLGQEATSGSTLVNGGDKVWRTAI